MRFSDKVQPFEIGDRVRIDIPDETDPDYSEFHGEHGTITSTIEDSHSTIYRVKFDSGQEMDFRRHDLRPPLE